MPCCPGCLVGSLESHPTDPALVAQAQAAFDQWLEPGQQVFIPVRHAGGKHFYLLFSRNGLPLCHALDLGFRITEELARDSHAADALRYALYDRMSEDEY